MNSNLIGSTPGGNYSFVTPFLIIGAGDANGNNHLGLYDTTFQVNISANGNPEFTVNSHAILFNVDNWSIGSTTGAGSLTWGTTGVLSLFNGSNQMVFTPATNTLTVNTTSFSMLNVVGPSNVGINASGSAGRFLVNGTQVVAARDTGWTAWTGTAAKGAFDTATATLVNCAQTLKAITDVLRTHGLIGT